MGDNKPTVTTKWQPFGTSVFTRMSQLANTHGAINLAQGFPDFDGPDAIKDAAIEAIRSGKNQYAPSAGLLELRQAVAKRREKTSGSCYDPESEVTIFSGATEAIYCALQAFLDPGQEVLAFSPFYDSYPAAALAAGLSFRGVPLSNDTFRVDPESLERAITPKTRAIIVNSPHNPSGRVFDDNECQAICDLAKKHNLLVITDEVYEELVYEPARHVSLATYPGMRERTVVISSTSKTFSLTGWKVGYAFASPDLTKSLRAVHQFTVFCSATPLQWGLLAAFELPESYYDSLRQGYVQRRDTLVSILQQAGFHCHASEGTYFLLANYQNLKDMDDEAFCHYLTKDIGVCCLPISGFYDHPQQVRQSQRFVRFGFCKEQTTLEQAGERLRKLGNF